jgi:hypothetical protein
MHTGKVIAAGLLLLGVFALGGHLFGNGSAGAAKAAGWFIAAWLVLAAANLLVGVVSAGYGVREELPIFLVVFAVPSGVALLLRTLIFATKP